MTQSLKCGQCQISLEQCLLYRGHECSGHSSKPIRTTAHLVCCGHRRTVCKTSQNNSGPPQLRPDFALGNRCRCQLWGGAESRADFIHKLKIVFKALTKPRSGWRSSGKVPCFQRKTSARWSRKTANGAGLSQPRSRRPAHRRSKPGVLLGHSVS